VQSNLGNGRSIALHPEELLRRRRGPFRSPRHFGKTPSRGRQWSTGWRGWCNWEYVRRGTSGWQKTKWQLLLTAAVANLVLVAAWESATGTSPGLGAASFSLLLQLTFLLFLVPSLIGEVKRRQHLVFPASVRGYVPQTPGFRPDF
jgi:hypothetical protein